MALSLWDCHTNFLHSRATAKMNRKLNREIINNLPPLPGISYGPIRTEGLSNPHYNFVAIDHSGEMNRSVYTRENP